MGSGHAEGQAAPGAEEAEEEDQVKVRLRLPGSEDDAFIFDSWMRSFRTSHDSGPYAPDEYFPACHTTIEKILARPGVEALMIADDERDLLAGYLVHEPGWQRWSRKREQLEQFHIVHYCYIVEQARRRGAARYLLRMAAVPDTAAYSFGTPAARALLGERARFLPDAGRYPSR